MEENKDGVIVRLSITLNSVIHPAPLNQNSTLPSKTLTFYLKLLLLVGYVIHNQSLIQHSSMRTAVGGLTDFTSEAECPFFFNVPLPAIR